MREAFEYQRNVQHSAAAYSMQDQAQAQQRARAMQIAAENRQMAELKRRNELADRVKDNMKQEMDVKRSKHLIQSTTIR